MAPFEEEFKKFAARVTPTRAFVLQGRTACDRCGFFFHTPIFFASGSNITPRTIAEATSTVCPRCEIAAQEARSP